MRFAAAHDTTVLVRLLATILLFIVSGPAQAGFFNAGGGANGTYSFALGGGIAAEGFAHLYGVGLRGELGWHQALRPNRGAQMRLAGHLEYLPLAVLSKYRPVVELFMPVLSVGGEYFRGTKAAWAGVFSAGINFLIPTTWVVGRWIPGANGIYIRALYQLRFRIRPSSPSLDHGLMLAVGYQFVLF